MSSSRSTRARWTIRLALVGLLLGALSLLVLKASFRSSRTSPADAHRLYLHLEVDTPHERVRELLGPPTAEEDDNGHKLSWTFEEETFNELRSVTVTFKIWKGKVIDRGMIYSTVNGWSVWNLRYLRFRYFLGM